MNASDDVIDVVEALERNELIKNSNKEVFCNHIQVKFNYFSNFRKLNWPDILTANPAFDWLNCPIQGMGLVKFNFSQNC